MVLLRLIEEEGSIVGLRLNKQKCKLLIRGEGDQESPSDFPMAQLWIP